MQSKKTLILAQLFISCIMSFAMSNLLTAFEMGLTMEWLSGMPVRFITAWPIAFVLTLIAGPIGFAIAGFLTRKRT